MNNINWKIEVLPKLNRIGNKKVNSISYRTKKIHIIIKFKFIWKFKSEVDLKPHS